MSGSPRVHLVPGRMLATIELDDQAVLDAAEVSDEWTDGMLAAKLGSAQPTITKTRPETHLGVGLRTTERTRELGLRRLPIHSATSPPHPALSP